VRKLFALVFFVALVAVSVFASGDAAPAQRSQGGYTSGNIGYDGRVAFIRIRYATGFGGFGRRGGGREPPWAHDYPTADIHLMKIVDTLTSVAPHVDGSNIFSLDDPELLKHPIAYVSEPGFWYPSDEEVAGFRTYLLKGGFAIFDDFRGQDWWNLEEQMKRVLPEARFIQLDVSHAVFHSFFDIKDLKFLRSYNDNSSMGGTPTYWGIFEENDPTKRLIAIANRDNDLGEYWEFSDTGMDPIDFSNEAYKYGVNYILYGLMQ
jgi:uncharacterized protein DUF4159